MAKQLVFGTIEFRVRFILSIANILKYTPTANLKVLDQNTSNWFANQPFKLNCLFSQSSSTAFSCFSDPYLRFMLEEGWNMQNLRKARRLNIIYQNMNNLEDVMVKTISDNPNFNINLTSINNKIKTLKPGVATFSSFYRDKYSSSTDDLISFDTILDFDNYKVLI